MKFFAGYAGGMNNWQYRAVGKTLEEARKNLEDMIKVEGYPRSWLGRYLEGQL